MIKFYTDKNYKYEDGKTIVKEKYSNSMVFIKGNRCYNIAEIKFYDESGILYHSYAYSWFCKINPYGYQGRDTNNSFEAVQFENDLKVKKELDFKNKEAFLFKDEDSKNKTYMYKNPITLYINVNALNGFKVESRQNDKLDDYYSYIKQTDIVTDDFRNIVKYEHIYPDNRLELIKRDLLLRIDNVIYNNDEVTTINYLLKLLDVEKYNRDIKGIK